MVGTRWGTGAINETARADAHRNPKGKLCYCPFLPCFGPALAQNSVAIVVFIQVQREDDISLTQPGNVSVTTSFSTKAFSQANALHQAASKLVARPTAFRNARYAVELCECTLNSWIGKITTMFCLTMFACLLHASYLMNSLFHLAASGSLVLQTAQKAIMKWLTLLSCFFQMLNLLPNSQMNLSEVLRPFSAPKFGLSVKQ